MAFAERYGDGGVSDIAVDMTNLTYDILAETLFSGEIAGEPGAFASQIDRLFETMGRVDPLDLLRAPDWLPRLTCSAAAERCPISAASSPTPSPCASTG